MALYLFLLGIGGMGAGFKWLGKDFTEQLLGAQATPLVALFIGILATTLVQSSSTTTTMTVTLVASGQLPYDSAIYIVMGANVGTTVTNTLVSLGHMRHTAEYRRAFAAASVHDFFNLIVLAILFPLEVSTHVLDKVAGGAAAAFQNVGGTKLADPIKLITKPVLAELQALLQSMGDSGVGMIIVSILLTFLALIYMVKLLKSIMVARLENLFDRVLFKSPIRSLFFGLLLTILVQSSSITTSIIVPLVGAGVLNIHQIFPYTMGANIGTTITALIASLAAMAGAEVGNPAAQAQAFLGLELAFHHVLFNIVGVALLWWVRWIPIWIAEWFAGVAMRNRTIPIAYILIVFYGIPFLVIVLGR